MFNKILLSQRDSIDGQNDKKGAELIKTKIMERMKQNGRQINSFVTSNYEDNLLNMIVLPEQIEVKFCDIGGLNQTKRDLTETVLIPLVYPQLTGSSRLCQPPLGVLFHGPPGTGKSMMAKAIARETNATFIS